MTKSNQITVCMLRNTKTLERVILMNLKSYQMCIERKQGQFMGVP